MMMENRNPCGMIIGAALGLVLTGLCLTMHASRQPADTLPGGPPGCDWEQINDAENICHGRTVATFSVGEPIPDWLEKPPDNVVGVFGRPVEVTVTSEGWFNVLPTDTSDGPTMLFTCRSGQVCAGTIHGGGSGVNILGGVTSCSFGAEPEDDPI